MSHLNHFRRIVKEHCDHNDGYRLKTSVRIKDIRQEKALNRIKEKLA